MLTIRRHIPYPPCKPKAAPSTRAEAPQRAKATYRPWTEPEKVLMLAEYKALGPQAMAARLRRPAHTVRMMAWRMKLTKPQKKGSAQ